MSLTGQEEDLLLSLAARRVSMDDPSIALAVLPGIRFSRDVPVVPDLWSIRGQIEKFRLLSSRIYSPPGSSYCVFHHRSDFPCSACYTSSRSSASFQPPVTLARMERHNQTLSGVAITCFFAMKIALSNTICRNRKILYVAPILLICGLLACSLSEGDLGKRKRLRRGKRRI
nr:hypothetical protein CFP56_76995 [Quercus suber]